MYLGAFVLKMGKCGWEHPLPFRLWPSSPAVRLYMAHPGVTEFLAIWLASQPTLCGPLLGRLLWWYTSCQRVPLQRHDWSVFYCNDFILCILNANIFSLIVLKAVAVLGWGRGGTGPQFSASQSPFSWRYELLHPDYSVSHKWIRHATINVESFLTAM